MDHSQGPGVPDEIVVGQGLVPGAGQKLFESSTFTCSHCETVVVMNPDRSRSRGYCPKCDHLVCDGCEARRVASGGVCYPFKAMCQDLLEMIDKGKSLILVNSDALAEHARGVEEYRQSTIYLP